jgi:hypothetical protein
LKAKEMFPISGINLTSVSLKGILPFICICLLNISYAQNYATSIIESNKKGAYLNYVNAALCSQKCQETRSIDLKKESQLLSFVGDLRSSFNRPKPEIDSSIFGLINKSAISNQGIGALDSIIGNNQIVIINEAHDRLVHRAFIYELLPLLKDKGFTHLAMETLSQPTSNLDISTGFYTSEPVMGEVYRKALELGFQLIAYEDTNNNASMRDSIQAVNLKNQLFVEGKLLKTAIICGYGHLYEWSESTDTKMMGQYIGEMTGVNPLTIDQVLIGEYSDNSYMATFYEALVQDSSIVFYKASFSNFIPPFSDIYIFHPKTKFFHNRPEYITLNQEKKWVELEGKEHTILVQAYLASEIRNKKDFNKRIPTDQTTYFEKGNFYLALRPNVQYVIVFRDETNRIIYKKSINVN